MSDESVPAFSERLRVPPSWWLVAMAVGVPVAAALGIYLGWWQVVVFTLAAIVGIAWALWSYGAAPVVADDAGLRAGDFRIPWEFVGTAIAHDAAATKQRLGPDADAAAALVVRGYIPTGVEVAIVDPADPHPYWFVSSRRPLALARAINARAHHAHPEAQENR